MKYFAMLTFVLLLSMSCASVTSGLNHEVANAEITNVQQTPESQYLTSPDAEKEIPFFRNHETSSAPCYYWIPTGEVEVIERGDNSTKKENSSDKKEEKP